MGIVDKVINTIDDTIDYSILLNIIQEKFETTTPLLETLVIDIEKEIMTRFKDVNYFFISIQKNNPPLSASVKSSEVILEKNY